MNIETERFWVVLRDAHNMVCSKRHTSRDTARAEAERLAAENPGQRFFVAAITGAAETKSVVWTELKNPNHY